MHKGGHLVMQVKQVLLRVTATYSFGKKNSCKVANVSDTPNQNHSQRQAFRASVHKISYDLG